MKLLCQVKTMNAMST